MENATLNHYDRSIIRNNRWAPPQLQSQSVGASNHSATALAWHLVADWHYLMRHLESFKRAKKISPALKLDLGAAGAAIKFKR